MTPALLEVLRVLPGAPERVRQAVAAVEPDELVLQATRHGLDALLAHELAAAEVRLSPDESKALRAGTLSTVASAMRVKHLLLKALDAFALKQVVPVLLKGYGISSRYYAEPLLRPMGDVDVLVRMDQLPAAEAALDGLGLQRKEEPAELYAREHHHHLAFGSELGMVELHFRALTGFGSTLEGESFYDRSELATVEGRAVRFLRPEDEVPYLATHAAQHLLLRLSWLFDLKLLIARTPSLRWGEVVAVAHASKMESPVYLSLWAARELLDAAVPEGVLWDLRPPAWQAQLMTRLFSEERVVDARLANRKWAQYATTPLLSTGVPQIARYALHHLGRGLRRKVAFRFPGVTPDAWRG